MMTVSTTAHVNGKSCTESEWLSHTIEGFLQLQYFCNNTSVFLQLHFAFLEHVPSTLRLNGTPLIQQMLRDEHGAFKKVIIFHYIFRHYCGVPEDLLDV